MHTTKKIMTQTAIGRFFPAAVPVNQGWSQRKHLWTAQCTGRSNGIARIFQQVGHSTEGRGGLQGDLFLIHVHQNGTLCTIVG